MHRFFLLDTDLVPGQSVDLSPISHQLSRVLRLSPGNQILLLDGENSEYPAEITMLDRGHAAGAVHSCRAVESEPATHLTLHQCSLKADKFEWVLQKGTELGVAAFVPVISQRSVVRPEETLLKKYGRWRAIIREAAEQSGRGKLPILRDPLSFPAAVNDAPGSRYLPWEEAVGQPKRLSLGQAIAEMHGQERCVSLMVGPEGGLTEGEAGLAGVAGWHVVSLGPRILRAETAALASVAIVFDRLAELGA